MALIHTEDLANWADLNVTRDNLGELLRRLIHANTDLPCIKTIRFLAHESNQLAGWDGILECQSRVSWVPSGTSVWERGAGKNDSKKIRAEFDKRCVKDLPPSWDREKTTYVAVTLRKLDDIFALLTELKTNTPWFDVKIVDAVAL